MGTYKTYYVIREVGIYTLLHDRDTDLYRVSQSLTKHSKWISPHNAEQLIYESESEFINLCKKLKFVPRMRQKRRINRLKGNSRNGNGGLSAPPLLKI